ncbi:lipase family protein [Swingsia samuiensis]|uniref:Uncharacterized protein n=1 Tax=Swingsia samuiensis TaxID=1293412 RepID=A0A4Y6UFL4_9PROT|nr:hypothetical protein [Swingsia samuiensis]QDH16339.1 hypothetical protein E3D00_01165 [Swingsia samuiensis]
MPDPNASSDRFSEKVITVELSGGRLASCAALADAEVLAHLANIAYAEPNTQIPANKIPPDYTDITMNNAELQPVTLTMDQLQRQDDHLRCRVFRSSAKLGNHYVIAFAGTNPFSLEDLQEDALQAFGFIPDQYRDAQTIGSRISKVPKNTNIIFTGHSLGGGLATVAGNIADRPVVVFNSAGVREKNILHGAHRPPVFDITSDYDPLTFTQNNRNTILFSATATNPEAPEFYAMDGIIISNDYIPKASGRQVRLEDSTLQQGRYGALLNPIANHGMGRVIKNIQFKEFLLRCPK